MIEVIELGSGKYKVLSSDGKTYYEVKPILLNEGKKPCSCKAITLQCKHLNKLVTYFNVKYK